MEIKFCLDRRKFYTCRVRFQPELPSRKVKKASPVTWPTLIATATTGGLLLAFMSYVRNKKEEAITHEQTRSIGRPALGGTFDLFDFNEKPCKSEDLHGQWLLIYFGFTHCPDVCPEEMEKLCEASNRICEDQNVPNVLPVFITVDPKRDSPQVIKKYCKEFSPRLLGLYGPPSNIDQVTRAFRIYHSEGPKDVDDDYLVDHSIFIFLIGPKGEMMEYFKQEQNADWITAKTKNLMKNYT